MAEQMSMGEQNNKMSPLSLKMTPLSQKQGEARKNLKDNLDTNNPKEITQSILTRYKLSYPGAEFSDEEVTRVENAIIKLLEDDSVSNFVVILNDIQGNNKLGALLGSFGFQAVQRVLGKYNA